MSQRVPSPEDFFAYNGAHTHRLWAEVGPDWECPAGHRTKSSNQVPNPPMDN